VKKLQVIDLLELLRRAYPNTDTSKESVDHHHKYLTDFPFDTARANVERHILTEKWPPNISEIRGRQGEQLERNRMREETQAYFAQLELWKRTAVPPPTGMREALYAKLGRTRED